MTKAIATIGLLVILCVSRSLSAEPATNSLGMKLVPIPAGEFVMGSRLSQAETRQKFGGREAGDFGTPSHPVKITKPFRISAHEVTRGQFQAFVAATGYKTDAEADGKGSVFFDLKTGEHLPASPERNWKNPGFEQDDMHPVVDVSWNDAVAFCKWLSQKEKAHYRLPTEAEWEYTCRAGTETFFHNGDDVEKIPEVGNIADGTIVEKTFPKWARQAIKAKDGLSFTAPVGSFKPNAWGLYDMHGNVFEWCSDWHALLPKDGKLAVDPTGPAEGTHKVRRGGGWNKWPSHACSPSRYRGEPNQRDAATGFRVVRDDP